MDAMGERSRTDNAFSLVLIDGKRTRDIVPVDANEQGALSLGGSVTVEATQRAARRVAKQPKKQRMEPNGLRPFGVVEVGRGSAAQDHPPKPSSNDQRRRKFDGR